MSNEPRTIKQILNNIKGLDMDSIQHNSDSTRPLDAAPILYLYSKLFSDMGIPSTLDYDFVSGIPVSVIEYLESSGFMLIWDNLETRRDEEADDYNSYIRACVLVNDKGYMLYITTGWTPWVNKGTDGSHIRDEAMQKLISDIMNSDDAITKYNSSKSKLSYLFVDSMSILIPPPYKRDNNIHNKVINSVVGYCHEYDSKRMHGTSARISMLMRDDYGSLYFKDYDVSSFTPDLKHSDIFYGNGFSDFDKELLNRLEHNKKGIILFHGEPGTGKTHYIRYLLKKLAEINKRIIYVPSSLIESMTDPSLINFLTESVISADRDTILLIEDAESLLESRDGLGGVRTAGISNLLNSTDGLLNDIMGLVVIATFNTDLNNIDSALLRPGRLMARKEFKKIPTDNLISAAKILGIDETKLEDNKNYTIAELLELKDSNNTLIHDHEIKERTQIGFSFRGN